MGGIYRVLSGNRGNTSHGKAIFCNVKFAFPFLRKMVFPTNKDSSGNSNLLLTVYQLESDSTGNFTVFTISFVAML